jgi:hypothetical protein
MSLVLEPFRPTLACGWSANSLVTGLDMRIEVIAGHRSSYRTSSGPRPALRISRAYGLLLLCLPCYRSQRFPTDQCRSLIATEAGAAGLSLQLC